jgi:pyruvate formate lyase activating enzyme
MVTGLIFNIQRYSLHDGPGIRTTVFLKGCPLRCWWCHNPEGISFARELMLHRQKCLGCGSCVCICPPKALSWDQSILNLNRDRCNLCLLCVDACPVEAIELAGKRVTPVEIVEEVIKDRVFFDQSGGGVTVSGGEPLAQPVFLFALLEALKNEKIHTAVDTSGFTGWKELERVSQMTDLFLFDLKILDHAASKKVTGRSNQIILENLYKLSQIHSNIQIRIPIIPTVNDDPDSIEPIARHIQALGINQVSVHPYHGLGVSKYEKTGQSYELPQIRPPAPEVMARIRSSLQQYGLKICE